MTTVLSNTWAVPATVTGELTAASGWGSDTWMSGEAAAVTVQGASGPWGPGWRTTTVVDRKNWPSRRDPSGTSPAPGSLSWKPSSTSSEAMKPR